MKFQEINFDANLLTFKKFYEEKERGEEMLKMQNLEKSN